MKDLLLLACCCTLLFNVSVAQQLFPVQLAGRWGYIDAKGHVAIKPQYRAAGPFSEGLAAARVNGTYGFIDTRGNLRIPARYDFALPFHRGVALVYLNGKPLLVELSGGERLAGVYDEILPAGLDGYWLVTTPGKRQGIIDDGGRLVIDTAYEEVQPMVAGRTVVVCFGSQDSPTADEDDRDARLAGVLDTSGHWVIPCGIWSSIAALESGYFTVVPRKNGAGGGNPVFLNRDGKLLFEDRQDDHWFIMSEAGLRAGITPVHFYVDDKDSIKKYLREYQNGYAGAVDTTGRIVFSNIHYEQITPFVRRRAFAESGDHKWVLTDDAGRRIGDKVFDRIITASDGDGDVPAFSDGRAFVAMDNRIAAIDTGGRFLIKPFALPGGVDAGDVRRYGEVLLLQRDISTEDHGHSYEYGFIDLVRKVTVAPRFYGLDIGAWNDSLIAVVTANDRPGYIDHSGRMVWLGPRQDTTVRRPLNIDFMNRGYFYASSSSDKPELAGYGGWGGSANKAMTADGVGSAALHIRIGTPDEAWQDWQGRHVVLVNGSADTAYFDAQDSRLYMQVQAKVDGGRWRDIEYLPVSWCGNSYHTMYLAPGEAWRFLMPVYEGSLPALLRIALRYRKTAEGERSEGEITLYSEQFAGSVNPGQFWRKREYFPSGLMDPYDE